MRWFLVVMLASACSNGGLALQGHVARTVRDGLGMRVRLIGVLARHPLWILGTVLSLLASVLQIVSLAHLPIVVVQPTMAAGVILVPVFEWLLGDGRLRQRDVIGGVVLVLAVAVLARSVPAGEVQAAADGVVLGSSAVVIGLAVGAARLLGAGGVALSVLAGLCFAVTGILAKVVATSVVADGSAGIALGVSGLVGFALVGFLSQMSALQQSPASTVAPIVLVVATVLPIVASRVVFEEAWPHPVVTSSSALVIVSTSAWLTRGRRLSLRPAGSGG